MSNPNPDRPSSLVNNTPVDALPRSSSNNAVQIRRIVALKFLSFCLGLSTTVVLLIPVICLEMHLMFQAYNHKSQYVNASLSPVFFFLTWPYAPATLLTACGLVLLVTFSRPIRNNRRIATWFFVGYFFGALVLAIFPNLVSVQLIGVMS